MIKMPGSKFLGEMPDWFDERGRWTMHKDHIWIVHPEHSPQWWDEDKGKWIDAV